MASENTTTVARQLAAVLKYHQRLGIQSYPATESVQKFLSLQLNSPPSLGTKSGMTGPGLSGRKKSVGQEQPAVLRLQDISEEIRTCRACDLHQWRLFSILGKEERKTKLLIVGDWLEVPAGSETKRESKFGEEEDQMLARMLTAINLSPHQVYVTNCIKCAVSADAQPKTEHVLRCFSHLQREIKAIKPEFICAMGVIPARCLLQKSQSLSHLRGKFHEYRVAENWTIPLLATYHPKFLLQNPEMKKAAWADLQLLAKKMGLMS